PPPAWLTGRTPRASAGANLRSLVQPDVVEARERHVLVEALDGGLHGAEAEDVPVADGGHVLVEALLHLVPQRLPPGRIGVLPDGVHPLLDLLVAGPPGPVAREVGGLARVGHDVHPGGGA